MFLSSSLTKSSKMDFSALGGSHSGWKMSSPNNALPLWKTMLQHPHSSKGVICEFLYKHSTAYSDKFLRLIWDQAWNNKAARPRQVLGTRVSIFQIRVCLFTLDSQCISYDWCSVLRLIMLRTFNAILSLNLRHSWKYIPISSPRKEAREILINAQVRVPFANFCLSIVRLF